jgi:hypothetical protein
MPGALRRDALIVLASFVVLGVLCGVLWSVVVTPAEFTKLANGGAMGEEDLGKKFGADGWYVVIAVLAGLLAGLVLSWWRSRDPVVNAGLLVVGSVVAAALMAVVGHLLGPGDPEAALRAAKLGAKVPERLDVDTLVAYLAWPVGALAGTFVVLMGRGSQAGTDGYARPGNPEIAARGDTGP